MDYPGLNYLSYAYRRLEWLINDGCHLIPFTCNGIEITGVSVVNNTIFINGNQSVNEDLLCNVITRMKVTQQTEINFL